MSRKFHLSESPLLHQKALTQVVLSNLNCEFQLSLFHFTERVRIHYPSTDWLHCTWQRAQHCIYSGKAFKGKTSKAWNFGKRTVVPSTCPRCFLWEKVSGFLFEKAVPGNSSNRCVFTSVAMWTKQHHSLCRWLVLDSEGFSKPFW